MAEYIDLEAAFNAITDFAGKASTRSAYEAIWKSARALKKLPAADVAPVVHGRWVHEHISEGYAWVMCSECEAVIHKILINKRLNYCPNCGAKMDGGECDEAG